MARSPRYIYGPSLKTRLRVNRDKCRSDAAFLFMARRQEATGVRKGLRAFR